jgi:hypothetical protein
MLELLSLDAEAPLPAQFQILEGIHDRLTAAQTLSRDLGKDESRAKICAVCYSVIRIPSFESSPALLEALEIKIPAPFLQSLKSRMLAKGSAN